MYSTQLLPLKPNKNKNENRNLFSGVVEYGELHTIFSFKRYIMVRKTLALIIMYITALTGCVSSTFDYIDPINYDVQTERLIPTTFDRFWDAYVAELSKTFFVINNIEKESRIINVSFASNTPSEYVDCGRANRTFNYLDTGKRLFNYEVADSSSYLDGVEGTDLYWTVNRNTLLDGRINIFMAPKGKQTLLRVNALYIWSTDASGVSNLGDSHQSKEKVTFSSGKPGRGRQEGQHPRTRCHSKGFLERTLLDLVEDTNY